MHARILYPLETFDMLIMMIDLSWLRILMPWFLLCFTDIFVWDIHMLVYWWLILLPCLAHWFWFCHDCSDHFTYIHLPPYIFWFDMLTHLLVYSLDHLWAWCLYHYSSDCRILAYLVCGHDDISEFCLIACRMTALLCVIACRLSMWLAHLPPYLQSSSLGHSFHFGSHFCKCETLCVLVLWPR